MDPVQNSSKIRFLSFEENDDKEKQAKLEEAALKIEEAISRQKSLNELIDFKQSDEVDSIDLSNDTRSLYDRLLEQRNKKKEAVEESQKLSNLVTKLDEEDVSYLDEVARTKREEEIKKRLEIYDVLGEKKRLDEKKILDEERKRKELLIGSNNIRNNYKASSSLKSKLQLTIKTKPKITSMTQKQNELNNLSPGKQTNANSKRDLSTTSTPSSSQIEVNKESKRQKTEGGKDDCSKEDRDSQNNPKNVEEEACSCSKKRVMKCIGILPSLPLVKKSPDSSNDSDNSDSELNRRIVPRIHK